VDKQHSQHMTIINLSEQNSVFNHFISEMRDKRVQKDSMRFRTNLERTGEIFAYEISKTLSYSTKEVETPLGIAAVNTFDDKIVLGTILRAGLPLHQGMLNIFDKAENAFLAAYRKYGKDNKFNFEFEYANMPSIDGKVLVIADAMIATGASVIAAYDQFAEKGTPKHTHIVCPFASSYGVECLSKKLPHKSVTLWVGAIDEELTNKSFIIPGLGDAGDLAFGSKH